MEKKRLAIAGCGKLGTIVADAVQHTEKYCIAHCLRIDGHAVEH